MFNFEHLKVPHVTPNHITNFAQTQILQLKVFY